MIRAPGHLTFLDHLRGIAILAVVVFHSGVASAIPALPWNGYFLDFNQPWLHLAVAPAALGQYGVAVFFVISGFCIHWSYKRSSTGSVRDFYLRRFFRIYPPYLLVLLPLAFGFRDNSLDLFCLSDLAQFLSHIFLVHNLHQRSYFGINPSFWSIGVEFQLYLIYPLLLMIERRLGWPRTLAVAAGIEVALRFVCAEVLTRDMSLGHFLIKGSPFYYWYSWSIGAAIADAVLNNRRLPLAGQPLLLWPILAVASWIFEPISEFTFLFFALATARCIVELIDRSREDAPRSRLTQAALEHLRFTGLVSYSLYLVHQPLLKKMARLTCWLLPADVATPGVVFVACLASWPVLLLISWLLYRWCEQPSIALGKWVVARLQSSVKPVTQA